MKRGYTWLKRMSVVVASVAYLSIISSVAAFAPPLPLIAEPYPTRFSRFYLESSSKDTTSKIIFSMIKGKGGGEPEQTKLTEEESAILVDSSEFEPLAEEGPWQAFLDDSNTGLIYYYNVESSETVWIRPTSTFPKVTMRTEDKKRVLAIRQEYADKQKSPFGWDRDSKRPSFLNSLYDGSKKLGNYPDLKTEGKLESKIKRNPYRNNAPVLPPSKSPSWVEDITKQLFQKN